MEGLGLTPYYDQDGITIYHGDCRDVLPAIRDVDVVFADPSYGITSLEWDRWLDGWPALVKPLLNRSGCLWCFGSLRSFLEHADDFAGWQLAQELIWEKHNGSSLHNDRFRRVHELLAQFYPVGARWSNVTKNVQVTMDETKRTVRRKSLPPQLMGARDESHYTSEDGGPRIMRSIIPVRSCHGNAVHPTQKPVGIVRPALAYSLPPSGLVIDPFMGSGTTLVVARELGARAIGIEAQERYCETAVKRLQQAVMPLAV
jgi:site-specific DNA-methyltransferase (adenine-specific)